MWLVILQEASGEGHFMNVYYGFKVLHREAERKESKLQKMCVSCSHSSGKGDAGKSCAFYEGNKQRSSLLLVPFNE